MPEPFSPRLHAKTTGLLRNLAPHAPKSPINHPATTRSATRRINTQTRLPHRYIHEKRGTEMTSWQKAAALVAGETPPRFTLAASPPMQPHAPPAISALSAPISASRGIPTNATSCSSASTKSSAELAEPRGEIRQKSLCILVHSARSWAARQLRVLFRCH